MPNTSIVIDRDCGTVWAYLMIKENWVRWWGGQLASVEPEWRPGAEVTWANGDRSCVSSLISQRELQLTSRFMETTINLEPATKHATTFTISSAPKGGANFSDGGLAHMQTLAARLTKLKQEVEASRRIGAVTAERKWWRFWTKNIH